MSLFKRGNVWWSYWYQDGIRHQCSTGTGSRKDAELVEKKLKEEANLRRFQVAQSRETIDDQIHRLRSTLIWSFTALGAGLLILTALQTVYGLWPLRRVRREVASIRSGRPINDGRRMAHTSLMAIMGRMAAYTGQEITWQMALNSKESLVPEHFDWKMKVPETPVAVPGRTKFV